MQIVDVFRVSLVLRRRAPEAIQTITQKEYTNFISTLSLDPRFLRHSDPGPSAGVLQEFQPPSSRVMSIGSLTTRGSLGAGQRASRPSNSSCTGDENKLLQEEKGRGFNITKICIDTNHLVNKSEEES